LLWALDARGHKIADGVSASVELQISILIIYSFLYFFSMLPKMGLMNSNLAPNKTILLSDKKVYISTLVLVVILSVYILPLALQYSGKTARAASIGYAHVLFEYSFSIAIAFTFYFLLHGRNSLKRISTSILLFFLIFVAVFVFQARSVAFFSILSVIIFEIYNKKINFNFLRLIKIKYLLISFVILGLFIGKHLTNSIFYDVNYDDWSLVFLDSLESFLISSSLNYVYKSGMSEFTLSTIFNNFIPGLASIDYHQFVKERIFHDSTYGMGRNPVGELWVNFKWFGVFIYSFILISKCVFFNYVIVRSEGVLKVFFTLLMLYGVFYINRNSIQTDIVFMRNYIFLILSLMVVSAVIFNSSLFNFKLHRDVCLRNINY
jgi:hypothetical protein